MKARRSAMPSTTLRLGLWLAVEMALALSQGAAAPAPRSAPETALKAAYLYKFGAFVEWPEGVFASPETPLTVCVVGQDPFGSLLDQAVENQKVNDRPVQVRRMLRPVADAACHIVFAAPTEGQPVSAVLAALKSSPVLTVTDGLTAGPARGMVHFRLVQNRLRFDVDLQAAADGKVAISSKLFSLAANVRRAGGRAP